MVDRPGQKKIQLLDPNHLKVSPSFSSSSFPLSQELSKELSVSLLHFSVAVAQRSISLTAAVKALPLRGLSESPLYLT